VAKLGVWKERQSISFETGVDEAVLETGEKKMKIFWRSN
jgi:hypothetical protein